MADRAEEIAALLLSEGALRHDDDDHAEVRKDLLGNTELFAEVARRLADVGYELVETLGHVGVRLLPRHAGRPNRLGLHAGHLRVLVYLWTHLVYREWTDLRRDRSSAAPGAEQALLGLDGDEYARDEPPAIAYSHVRAELSEVMSDAYFTGVMRALKRHRFIRYDKSRRDRIWADAALYTLVDIHRMEDFLVDLARRMGASDVGDAVRRVTLGAAVPTTSAAAGAAGAEEDGEP